MGSAIVQQVRPVALTHAEQVGIDLCEPVIERSPPLANQWDRQPRTFAKNAGLVEPPREDVPHQRVAGTGEYDLNDVEPGFGGRSRDPAEDVSPRPRPNLDGTGRDVTVQIRNKTQGFQQ